MDARNERAAAPGCNPGRLTRPQHMRPENLAEPEAHAVKNGTETALCPQPRTFRRSFYVRDTLTILACAVALVAICLAKGWLETHGPQVLAGLSVVACIALLGVLVSAVVAGPKS